MFITAEITDYSCKLTIDFQYVHNSVDWLHALLIQDGNNYLDKLHDRTLLQKIPQHPPMHLFATAPAHLLLSFQAPSLFKKLYWHLPKKMLHLMFYI